MPGVSRACFAGSESVHVRSDCRRLGWDSGSTRSQRGTASVGNERGLGDGCGARGDAAPGGLDANAVPATGRGDTGRRTVNTVEDQVGLTFVGGVAGGVGANVSAGPYLQVSNAEQLSDLASPFLFATVGAEYLAGASVTYFWSPDRKFWGVSAGPSFGAGADLAAGVSWTNVVQLHGLSAALARIAWDASSIPVLNIAYILSNAKTAVDKLNSSICD